MNDRKGLKDLLALAQDHAYDNPVSDAENHTYDNDAEEELAVFKIIITPPNLPAPSPPRLLANALKTWPDLQKLVEEKNIQKLILWFSHSRTNKEKGSETKIAMEGMYISLFRNVHKDDSRISQFIEKNRGFFKKRDLIFRKKKMDADHTSPFLGEGSNNPVRIGTKEDTFFAVKTIKFFYPAGTKYQPAFEEIFQSENNDMQKDFIEWLRANMSLQDFCKIVNDLKAENGTLKRFLIANAMTPSVDSRFRPCFYQIMPIADLGAAQNFSDTMKECHSDSALLALKRLTTEQEIQAGNLAINTLLLPKLKETFTPVDYQAVQSYLARELLTLLHSMHANKIYHRDIKPSNIMFDTNGNVFISDPDSSLLIHKNHVVESSRSSDPTYWLPDDNAFKKCAFYRDQWALSLSLLEILGDNNTRLSVHKYLHHRVGKTSAEVNKCLQEILSLSPLPHSVKLAISILACPSEDVLDTAHKQLDAMECVRGEEIWKHFLKKEYTLTLPPASQLRQ